MKFYPYLIVASLFICKISTAQNHIHFGIKGGCGLSTFEYKKRDRGYYNLELTWTPSFYGGFMANAPFGKFFFQPEVLYSLRGFRYPNHTRGTRYHYLSMPLLLGFKPLKNLSILAGPEFGYVLSSRSHFTMNGPANTTKYITYRNTIDIDAGLAWAITPKLQAEARYVCGIKPLYREATTSGTNPEFKKDGYGYVFQIGASYRLR
ncbi:porin family protein [Longitalea arenae]|uniref:porin family protein n=1 Tax=Longitalea arenae TaxID=2812558 RepID=UPI001966D3E3|nr:porin family protein [Longitalea arenae]